MNNNNNNNNNNVNKKNLKQQLTAETACKGMHLEGM